MTTRDDRNKARLAIEIEPELRQRIETAAAERGMAVRDYVVAVLHNALASSGAERPSDASGEFSRLSIPSFARDWESDADAVYDDLA